MDPVTHTLLGANLAACPPARRLRLAGPALVIGANLPDVDVLSYLGGGDLALGFRRGWTHGAPALALLPLLLWAGLLLWDRGRAPAGRSAPHPGKSPPRLLACCYLAVLSHPALDWLNTYGMRWWMPLDGAWSYGDSIFIVDPWLWLILGGAWLSRRRPGGARRVAAGLVAAALWIAMLVVLHAAGEARVRAELAARSLVPAQLMVGPRPANPLAWDVVARAGGRYHLGRFAWPGGELVLDRTLGDARADPMWPRVAAAAGEQAPGFLGWARFPWLEIDDGGGGALDVHLMDARYRRRRTTGFGGTRIRVPRPAPAAGPARP